MKSFRRMCASIQLRVVFVKAVRRICHNSARHIVFSMKEIGPANGLERRRLRKGRNVARQLRDVSGKEMLKGSISLEI